MSRLKKIVAAVMAAATVSALSVSAFADYAHPEFSFNLNAHRTAYSSPADKQDNLNYAMANCKEGNIDSTAYMWLSVVDANTYGQVSGEVKATSLNNYRLDYYSGKYSNGSSYRLRGKTEAYGAYVKGKWDP
ncbi:MAG: hypothetical protein NC452_15305 [Eubacterium sp.]|nr:hypothetical protein [Eubacterium sp.]